MALTIRGQKILLSLYYLVGVWIVLLPVVLLLAIILSGCEVSPLTQKDKAAERCFDENLKVVRCSTGGSYGHR